MIAHRVHSVNVQKEKYWMFVIVGMWLELTVEVCLPAFSWSGYMSLCFAAPCLTKGLTNCSKCSSSSCYNSEFKCSCDTNCFLYGNCCSDISTVVENCFGKSTKTLMPESTLSSMNQLRSVNTVQFVWWVE